MLIGLIKHFLRRQWGIWGLVVAFGLGVAVLGTTTVALRWTNTLGFCISCHEMRDNVYEEYKDTIHAANRTGVRAVCSDCHVPHDLGPLLVRKVKATFELWDKVTGKIDTREKFQAHRYEMALSVWREMKENDSLECRNCHHREAMSAKKQSEKAKDRHAKADRENMTCIDCHFGIAHEEPEGELGPQDIKVN